MTTLPAPPTRQVVQLRGDYSVARADYTVAQEYRSYTAVDQDIWRRLFVRQQNLLARYAAPQVATGLRLLGCEANAIPRFEDLNERLGRLTGWCIVAVPGLIPERDFFRFLAGRKFPVTTWMRRPEELDYLVEPDLFHDCFGHLPMLTDPDFGNFVQAYGERGACAEPDELQRLARLYWYTVEFGLLRTLSGLRAYGAGILSSYGETLWAIDSPQPRRLSFDAAVVRATPYVIDEYQRQYFVIESFEQLIESVLEPGLESRAHRVNCADAVGKRSSRHN